MPEELEHEPAFLKDMASVHPNLNHLNFGPASSTHSAQQLSTQQLSTETQQVNTDGYDSDQPLPRLQDTRRARRLSAQSADGRRRKGLRDGWGLQSQTSGRQKRHPSERWLPSLSSAVLSNPIGSLMMAPDAAAKVASATALGAPVRQSSPAPAAPPKSPTAVADARGTGPGPPVHGLISPFSALQSPRALPHAASDRRNHRPPRPPSLQNLTDMTLSVSQAKGEPHPLHVVLSPTEPGAADKEPVTWAFEAGMNGSNRDQATLTILPPVGETAMEYLNVSMTSHCYVSCVI